MHCRPADRERQARIGSSVVRPGWSSGTREHLSFDRVLDSGPPEWGSLQGHLFAGAPLLSELVLFHPGSRTIVVTDLAFNVRRDGRNEARLFHWLVGAVDHFGPHRLIRGTAFRDRAACRCSVEAVLAWDFDRVVGG